MKIPEYRIFLLLESRILDFEIQLRIRIKNPKFQWLEIRNPVPEIQNSHREFAIHSAGSRI